MNNTLYDIKQEYLELIQEVEEMEGELTPETEYKLNINQSELQNKAVAYHSYILSKDSFNMQIDSEIKRLQALKKKNNNVIENLKSRLIGAIQTFGEFTVGTNIFGLRKSERVEIEDVNLLSKEYKTIKVTEQADKIAIKKALKEGKQIENAYIVEQYNLKIK
tara:strand:- start:2821 stop:3309 length:489 start_codon:yes stop_codon:yes gene_type:complete